MLRELEKSYDECNIVERVAIERGYAKTIDAPAGFRVGSVLRPDQIYTTISRIVDQSNFLKMINYDTIKMGTTADLNCWSMTEDGTVRVTYGTESSTPTMNISNVGNKISLLPMQELYFLADDVVQEKLDQQNFSAEVNSKFIIQCANNLAKLALNGTADTGGSFLALQKGFPTLFKADATVVDVTYSSYATVLTLFQAMHAAMLDKYADNPNLTFFVNRADYLAYGSALQTMNASGQAFVEGKQLYYKGIPVIWIPKLPASTAFLTDPKNLYVMFSASNMSLETDRRPRASGTYLVMNYQADFGYVNGEQIVFAWTP